MQLFVNYSNFFHIFLSLNNQNWRNNQQELTNKFGFFVSVMDICTQQKKEKMDTTIKII